MYFLDGACGGLIDELLGSYGIVNDYECVSVDIHILLPNEVFSFSYRKSIGSRQ